MANEIAHEYNTGSTLYHCRWDSSGDVFLTNGASSEVWGTGGRDASDYAVAMAENAPDGHFIGDFDTSANITTEAVYKVAVFLQETGVPLDADFAVAEGEIYWNGTSEDTLISISGQLDGLTSSAYKIINVYGPGE
jgi:hypothetical protein